MPIVTRRKRTPEEFAMFVQDIAQRFPNGFRTPGKKLGSTSLVQEASLRAGFITPDDLRPDRSSRGERKAEGRAWMKERFRKIARDGVDPKYLHASRTVAQ